MNTDAIPARAVRTGLLHDHDLESVEVCRIHRPTDGHCILFVEL